MRWIRRVVFSLVPLVVLVGAVELGLRWTGWEAHLDREVSWCREHAELELPLLPAAALDPGSPGPGSAPRDPGGQDEIGYRAPAFSGHPRPFPVRKSSWERRVFVLGGSAAHGYGFSRNGSFSAGLEEILNRAHPAWDTQVMNLGAIAWSSQQVLRLAKEVLERHEPDLLVLYTGNNELLEWWDWRKYLPAPAHRLFVAGLRWQRRLAGLRSFLWLRQGVLGLDPHRWGQTRFTDDEALPWSERARLTEADRAWALENWRYNVGRILEEASERSVPVVMSTVAVNWMDPPGSFPFRGPEVQEPAENLQALDEADAALAAGRPEQAERRFHEAWARWPEAITHWRWGDLYRRHQFPERARPHLKAAVRLDENPHRVLPAINAAVSDLARTHRAVFVDGAAAVARQAPDGISGFEEVYDHCHPTLQSHAVLAEHLAAAILERIWPPEQAAAAPDPVSWRRERNRAWNERGEESWRVEQFLGVDLEAGSADYLRDPVPALRRRWRQARDRALREGSGEAWNRAGVIAFHAFHADARRRPGEVPSLQAALDAFRAARAAEATHCLASANLGRLWFEVGQTARAQAALLQALRCDPGDETSAALLSRLRRWERSGRLP